MFSGEIERNNWPELGYIQQISIPPGNHKTIKPYPGDSRNTNSLDFEKIQSSIDSSL